MSGRFRFPSGPFTSPSSESGAVPEKIGSGGGVIFLAIIRGGLIGRSDLSRRGPR